ncbi:hypothetical protein CV014_28290 [Nostoc sp. CMAA1605]|nr:hypothetical protein [Nostoc sp. CMAA1605]
MGHNRYITKTDSILTFIGDKRQGIGHWVWGMGHWALGEKKVSNPYTLTPLHPYTPTFDS